MHGRGTAAIQTGALRWKRDGDSHFPGRSFTLELQDEGTFFFGSLRKNVSLLLLLFFLSFCSLAKNFKFVEIDKSAFSPVLTVCQ